MTDSSSHSHRTSETRPDRNERFEVDRAKIDPAVGDRVVPDCAVLDRAVPDCAEGLGRRHFIARTGRCLSALLAAGAATSLGGCTLPVRSFQAPREGRIVIPRSRFPELRLPGGLIKVRHPDRPAVYVRCTAEEEYDAISGECTHQGCVVDPVGENFHCPCHGSTFDRNGANTSGPARAPLERFVASLSGDSVILDFSESLSHE